jgi:hypothetical protein
MTKKRVSRRVHLSSATALRASASSASFSSAAMFAGLASSSCLVDPVRCFTWGGRGESKRGLLSKRSLSSNQAV